MTTKANGKIALVTGANKGIGKAIVRGMARDGFTVFLGARDPEKGRAAVAELKTEGDVRFVQLVQRFTKTFTYTEVWVMLAAWPESRTSPRCY
jgi:NAD(P)-dependent dehydrogenase (short-subunit alcohol dehydrogenase family)